MEQPYPEASAADDVTGNYSGLIISTRSFEQRMSQRWGAFVSAEETIQRKRRNSDPAWFTGPGLNASSL